VWGQPDGVQAHARFRSRYRLPFSLLSDKGGRVAALYGASHFWGMAPLRVTFILDREAHS